MFQLIMILSLLLPKPVNNAKHVIEKSAPNFLKTGWYYISDKKNNYPRQLDQSNEQYYIDPKPIVLASHFSAVKVQEGNYGSFILINFDAYGTAAWSTATGVALNKKLALIIDDKLIFTPQVNAQITSGVSALNRGIYSLGELERLTKLLRAEM
jgi:preprotein translocase subunit SecD